MDKSEQLKQKVQSENMKNATREVDDILNGYDEDNVSEDMARLHIDAFRDNFLDIFDPSKTAPSEKVAQWSKFVGLSGSKAEIFDDHGNVIAVTPSLIPSKDIKDYFNLDLGNTLTEYDNSKKLKVETSDVLKRLTDEAMKSIRTEDDLTAYNKELAEFTNKINNYKADTDIEKDLSGEVVVNDELDDNDELVF